MLPDSLQELGATLRTLLAEFHATIRKDNFHLLAFTLGVLGSTAILVNAFRRKSRLPLPGGPPGMPLLGNLGQLGARQLWEQYFEWSKTYGPVVYLNAGGKPWVILNTARSITDLLEKRSRIYSDRPHDTMSKLIGFDRMIFRTSSEDKKFPVYRKVIASELGPRVTQRHWPIQENEVHKMLGNMLNQPERYVEWFTLSSISVIMKIVYGYDLKSLQDPFVQAVIGAAKLSGNRNPGKYWVDSFPILRFVPSWFPGAAFKRHAQETRNKMDEMSFKPVNWTKQQLASGSQEPSLVSRLLAPGALPPGYGEDHVAYSTVALFIGGTDTTAGTLEQLPLHMMLNTDCQRRAQAELDSVLRGPDGSLRLPTMEDRDSLPYVDAVMKELLRWHPIGVLGLPHAVIQEDEYEGMKIPKGSVVVANIWAAMHDESVYPNPGKFDPDRFTGPEEKQQTNPYTFAFGFGRRVCPGLYFAQWSLFLTIASMIASFDFSIPVEDGKPVMPVLEFTGSTVVSHVKPYKVVIKPRSKEWADLVKSQLAQIEAES